MEDNITRKSERERLHAFQHQERLEISTRMKNIHVKMFALFINYDFIWQYKIVLLKGRSFRL